MANRESKYEAHENVIHIYPTCIFSHESYINKWVTSNLEHFSTFKHFYYHMINCSECVEFKMFSRA